MKENKNKKATSKQAKKLAAIVARLVDNGTIKASNVLPLIRGLGALEDASAKIDNELVPAIKKGEAGLIDIIHCLAPYSTGAITSILDLISNVGDKGHYYKECLAKYQAKWGAPSYIVSNVVNGTKQKVVSNRSKAYRVIADVVADAKQNLKDCNWHNYHLKLDGVVKVSNSHYIAFIFGGNNGSPNWFNYLRSLEWIVSSDKLDDAWLINLKNDCSDDVHYALIGFTI